MVQENTIFLVLPLGTDLLAQKQNAPISEAEVASSHKLPTPFTLFILLYTACIVHTGYTAYIAYTVYSASTAYKVAYVPSYIAIWF